VLTFLHLSDLHITTEDAGTQFDRDFKIREALLDDLGKEGRTGFDAILVTGTLHTTGVPTNLTGRKSGLRKCEPRPIAIQKRYRRSR